FRNGVKAIIVHHTGRLKDADAAIRTFQERGLPAHFIIDREGKVYRALPDGAIGQQIRVGTGKGAGLSNANTEGIEIIAADDKDLLPVQVAAAKALIQERAQRWGIDANTAVFGHGEVNRHKEVDEGKSVVEAIRNDAEKASYLKTLRPPTSFDAMSQPERD